MTTSMEPMMALASKYRNEFESTVDTLRKRSASFSEEAEAKKKELAEQLGQLQQQLQQQLEPRLRETQSAVQELSPVPQQFGLLLETYAWAAVLLIGVSGGRLLGGYVLAPLLGLVLDTVPALALTFVLLPALFYLRYRKNAPQQTDARFELLGLAVALGLLSGFLLADKHLGVLTPPAFLLPLIIGVSAQVLGPRLAHDRRLFLAATVGAGVGLYALLGLLFGQLSLTYFAFMLVAAVGAVVHLQLLLKDVEKGAADMILAQLALLMASVFATTLLTALFGSAKHASDKTAEVVNTVVEDIKAK